MYLCFSYFICHTLISFFRHLFFTSVQALFLILISTIPFLLCGDTKGAFPTLVRIQWETPHKDFNRNLANWVLHIIITVIYSVGTEYKLDEAINSPTHGETKPSPIKDVIPSGLISFRVHKYWVDWVTVLWEGSFQPFKKKRLATTRKSSECKTVKTWKAKWHSENF